MLTDLFVLLFKRNNLILMNEPPKTDKAVKYLSYLLGSVITRWKLESPRRMIRQIKFNFRDNSHSFFGLRVWKG